MNRSNLHSYRQGFTLIELSIVLVIIGLIVGGVLVGQDLIHAAQLKRDITATTSLKTAVATFMTKYDCLPGDCPNAVAFGLGVAGGNGDNGDGNGLINDNPAHSEDTNAFTQLANAGLIAAPAAPDPNSYLGGHLLFRSGREGYFIFVSIENINYLYMVSDRWPNGDGGVYSTADAYAFDTKLDDGLPGSTIQCTQNVCGGVGFYSGGTVWVWQSRSVKSNAALPQPCVDDSVTPNVYYLANTSPSVSFGPGTFYAPPCTILFRLGL